MKNNLLFLSLMILFFTANSQNAPIDFEEAGHGATWEWTVFENDTDPPLEIIENPDMTGINTSPTVALFTALAEGAPFAGCETTHGAGIGTFSLTPSTSNIKIMVWKSVISDVGIKLVDAGNGSLGEIKIANTLVDQWEEISFDFSDMEGIVYDQIVIFPDFQDRDEKNIIYFDNITFGEQIALPVPMEPAPDPIINEENVLSLFSNVYSDVPVDTWQTPWSQGTLEDIQIMGNDTKKYTNLNFVGVETLGSNLVDATEMEFFHVDVWTPNMTTFRIKLVDFGADENFQGGDDSEHELIFDNHTQNSWVSYNIPLSDFSGLNAKDNLAQLIFSGLPAGQGVVYIDNVFFFKNPNAVNDFEANDIQLFPNPVSENFTLNAPQNIEEIVIYNEAGILVLEKKNLGTNANINIADLPKGTYLISAMIDGRKLIDRLIKQ